MVEKSIRGRIFLFIDVQKLITNTWKIMIKIKDRHILNIGMQIIYMVGHVARASSKWFWMDQRYFSI